MPDKLDNCQQSRHPVKQSLDPCLESFSRGASDTALQAPREPAQTVAHTHSRHAGPSALDQGVAGAQTP